MDLTSIFNSASGGGEGAAATANNGVGPASPGGAQASVAYTSGSPPESSATSSLHANSQNFNNAVAMDSDAALQATNRTETGESPAVASAEAELAVLETLRPKPLARQKINPATHIKRAADLTAERQRLARMRAVKAFLEFEQQDNFFEKSDHLEDTQELSL